MLAPLGFHYKHNQYLPFWSAVLVRQYLSALKISQDILREMFFWLVAVKEKKRLFPEKEISFSPKFLFNLRLG